MDIKSLKWKLKTESTGRQYWEFSDEADSVFNADFTFNKAKNPNSADKIYRFQKTQNFSPTKEEEFLKDESQSKNYQNIEFKLFKGIDFYTQLITENGFITGDYGGPHFLLPGLIIGAYITNQSFSEAHIHEFKKYFFNHQNEDGGWGLHIEGESTLFGTAMQYVALRLLGESAESYALSRAQDWIRVHGGAVNIPSWGKFYLSVLGVYDWKGCHSLFPELWILPTWLPFHPWRYWCHARMVYLPMAYCFANKITAPENDLIVAIRKEIYLKPYAKIDWESARNACCEKDVFHQPLGWMKWMNKITNSYEKIHSKWLRRKASSYLLKYINAEDLQTNFINIGPVNQVINSIAVWHGKGEKSFEFQSHVDRWKDYLWLAEDGMKMQGYNGSQLWDTAFTINAILASPKAINFVPELKKMYRFIDKSQIQKNIPAEIKFFRHEQIGGWPFSTLEHGWPITDCTADGLKASLLLNDFFQKENSFPENLIESERLQKSVDLLLSFQSKDGGWASYEIRRGGEWLEKLNPSEIFGEIMVDYSYVECTSSTIQALVKFNQIYPTYRPEEIKNKIKKGIHFIKSKQLEDGSWYGSWGVCFTYAAWFALEALACVGENYNNSNTVKKGCDFLISKQDAAGSLGESYQSCVLKKYVPHATGQIVHTSWAMLGLMAAGYPTKTKIEKGVQFILGKQEENGDFPQEGITGTFNKNCMITYTSYRNIFPLWAIGKWLNVNRN